VNERLQRYQDKMKALFDQKAKDREFIPSNLVLKWESRKEDARKHGKFDPIWSSPYRILALEGKKLWLLENLDGDILNAPVNG
jgi:hypothetical protein